MSFDDLRQHLTELKRLSDELRSDVERAAEALRTGGVQADRRGYVRALFAFVEGENHMRRQVALSFCADLTVAEATCLSEINYSLDDSGKENEHSSYPSLLAATRFSLRMYSRASGATFEPTLSANMLETVRV